MSDVRELGRHRACGKLILLGEHFVVYDVPALALPVTVVSTEVVVVEDSDATAPLLITDAAQTRLQTARGMLEKALELLRLEETLPWRVEVRSTIPQGCGLGSSAAFAVALVGALARAGARQLTLARHNELAHTLEGLVHGTPSGIDNTTISHRRPVWFARGRPVELLDGPGTLELVLASSGRPGSTREAVAGVSALRAADRSRFEGLCLRARTLVQQGREAFIAGDAPRLGRLMRDNHALLQQVGVSTDRLDGLVAAAEEAGALGAKLTGGGRGGFVVALAAAGQAALVADALTSAGAAQSLAVGPV